MGLAYNCMERAAEHLANVHEEFNKQHPEHAQLLELMTTNVFLTQQWIKDFWEGTWGPMPKDVRRWRDRQPKDPEKE